MFHPKLEGAARINNVTMNGLLTGADAATAYSNAEWPRLRTNTERRVAMIRHLFRKLKHGDFFAESQTADLAAGGDQTKPAKAVSVSDSKSSTGCFGGTALAAALDIGIIKALSWSGLREKW